MFYISPSFDNYVPFKLLFDGVYFLVWLLEIVCGFKCEFKQKCLALLKIIRDERHYIYIYKKQAQEDVDIKKKLWIKIEVIGESRSRMRI